MANNNTMNNCFKCDPNASYRQKYTEEEFARLPLIINYIEDGNKKVVDARPEFARSFSPEGIMPYFEEAFRLERNCNGDLRRISPSDKVLEILSQHLELLIEQLSEELPKSLKALFRYFRNIAANSNSQLYIVHNTKVLEAVTKLAEFVLSRKNYQAHLKIPFQLLINLISANENIVRAVYQKCSGFVKLCMYSGYHIYECSAFFYNASIHIDFSDFDLFGEFVRHYNSDNDNEYIHFFLENAIARNDFWAAYRQFLKLENQVKVLEFLIDKILKDKDIKIDLSCIKVLSEDFVTFSCIFYQTDIANQLDQVRFISLILQILSSLSGNEQYLPVLQGNKDLFIHMGVVLINLHNLAKQAGNFFSPVRRLSEISNEELIEHPAIGFKADVIRYLGNMCWKNPEIQDLARTAELIPIILDTCNIDEKNPFIMQWCILAIRNLCEGNIANQNLIASLQRIGVVKSATLEEMGITLESDGENKIKIVPLDRSKLK